MVDGVDLVPLVADQRHGQVEPEPVDAHLLDPVPQRVHHQPADLRVRGVDRVAGPVTSYHRGAVREPVVRAVVDAAEAQRRPVEAALAVWLRPRRG